MCDLCFPLVRVGHKSAVETPVVKPYSFLHLVETPVGHTRNSLADLALVDRICYDHGILSPASHTEMGAACV